MHQTRVRPGRGVASYPLQHSPPNFQHLPHTQPGPLQTNQTNQLPLRHRRALQPKKLQRKHLHPLLPNFHRGHHARETHGRVPSHDRAHFVDHPEQNRRRRSAPNLGCYPCGSSFECDLFRHICGISPHLWHVSPLADCFYSWRAPERAAPPLPPLQAPWASSIF